jgi:hypothetical protein
VGQKKILILLTSVIGVFVGFSRIFLLGISIVKGLTARRLYKSFRVKGLICYPVRHSSIPETVTSSNAADNARILPSATFQ